MRTHAEMVTRLRSYRDRIKQQIEQRFNRMKAEAIAEVDLCYRLMLDEVNAYLAVNGVAPDDDDESQRKPENPRVEPQMLQEPPPISNQPKDATPGDPKNSGDLITPSGPQTSNSTSNTPNVPTLENDPEPESNSSEKNQQPIAVVKGEIDSDLEFSDIGSDISECDCEECLAFQGTPGQPNDDPNNPTEEDRGDQRKPGRKPSGPAKYSKRSFQDFIPRTCPKRLRGRRAEKRINYHERELLKRARK